MDPADADASELEGLFLEALEHMQQGQAAPAKELLRRILSAEPRLPEPYLELAILIRDEGDIESAVEAARMGLELLEKGGQWIESVPAHVLLAHAKNLLGELLVELAQEAETPFDPPAFARLWNEAVALFRAAHQLDPDNEAAHSNAVLHRPMTTPDSLG